MGTEMPAEFYDQFIDRHLIPLEKSPWRKVYEEAARLLPESKDETIVDIGCGTGRFAKLLFDKGYRKYLGIDFSKGMLEEAKRYNPSFTFIEGNVYDEAIVRMLQKYHVFVLLEVLEHIEKDKAFLSSLPQGSDMVISVPNYDSRAHVRHFKHIDEVIERYDGILDFQDSEKVVIKTSEQLKNEIYVLNCKKR
ncbi:methyltransferase domain-containing protein [Bacillus haynesii]|uniref:SAM-dependent methyltransferase n=1 Tax=Bacillus haynesii TaxID=1925021 RepID=A0ABX3I8C9_9BACI|nr:methyltransferase domain-containing protein [Bacillus haynesii]MCI4128467.1 methyltransferase domain-containing protein [Bacillus haynesii]MCY7772415.1 methyltransferase domain-containing protein [Bacillus haynesii]MCY8013925.1 methyltransferase domain-containing protein [Bacillus haynesii]MCY8343571.1 methyltransferase domain-containing protein [Bacillus haynesii]MCY9371904.1 methyltransferase domain-containing protein [Bacillus haynesii]